jgi:hypothetical protein
MILPSAWAGLPETGCLRRAIAVFRRARAAPPGPPSADPLRRRILRSLTRGCARPTTAFATVGAPQRSLFPWCLSGGRPRSTSSAARIGSSHFSSRFVHHREIVHPSATSGIPALIVTRIITQHHRCRRGWPDTPPVRIALRRLWLRRRELCGGAKLSREPAAVIMSPGLRLLPRVYTTNGAAPLCCWYQIQASGFVGSPTSKQTQRAPGGGRRPVVAPAHERADRRGGVQDRAPYFSISTNRPRSGQSGAMELP